MASRGGLILLDTHIWLWSIFKSPKLEREYAELIQLNIESVCVSLTSCWEIAMLVGRRRLDLGMPASKWFERIFDESEISLFPLTPAITAEAYELPGTFHQDPADRMIVATARLHDCLLVTEDQKIIEYPFVETA